VFYVGQEYIEQKTYIDTTVDDNAADIGQTLSTVFCFRPALIG